MSVSFKPNGSDKKEDNNDNDDDSVSILENKRKYNQLCRYVLGVLVVFAVCKPIFGGVGRLIKFLYNANKGGA